MERNMRYTLDNLASENTCIKQEEFILSTGLPELPILTLYLNIDTTTSNFTGSASLSQADASSPSFSSAVSGQYIPLVVKGEDTPVYSGRGCLLNIPMYDNFEFSFDLADAKTGRFKYKTSIDSDWVIVENAKVEQLKNRDYSTV